MNSRLPAYRQELWRLQSFRLGKRREVETLVRVGNVPADRAESNLVTVGSSCLQRPIEFALITYLSQRRKGRSRRALRKILLFREGFRKQEKFVIVSNMWLSSTVSWPRALSFLLPPSIFSLKVPQLLWGCSIAFGWFTTWPAGVPCSDAIRMNYGTPAFGKRLPDFELVRVTFLYKFMPASEPVP